jgi:hypothetical protein
MNYAQANDLIAAAEIKPLTDSIAEINDLYPFLPRSDVPNHVLRAAIKSGDERLEELGPFIAACAYLRLRGFVMQAVVAYIFCPDFTVTDLQRTVDAVAVIESCMRYQYEYKQQYKALDVFSIYNEAIAHDCLRRLAATCTTPSVRAEAIKMADCIAATFVASNEDPRRHRSNVTRIDPPQDE